MKPTKTWILIANGDNARIVENDGPGKGVFQPTGLVSHASDPVPFSDQPGRSYQSAGGSRSKLEPHQNVKTERNSFAGELVNTLALKHNEGRFDRLVICAAPAMLSQVKDLLPPALQSQVIAEIPKDLTQIPTHKLASHFENYLAI